MIIDKNKNFINALSQLRQAWYETQDQDLKDQIINEIIHLNNTALHDGLNPAVLEKLTDIPACNKY